MDFQTLYQLRTDSFSDKLSSSAAVIALDHASTSDNQAWRWPRFPTVVDYTSFVQKLCAQVSVQFGCFSTQHVQPRSVEGIRQRLTDDVIEVLVMYRLSDVWHY